MHILYTCPKLPPPPHPDACRQRTCFVALCSELLTFCCSIWQDAEGKEHEVLLNHHMRSGQRQKQSWEISAHIEWSDSGWFILDSFGIFEIVLWHSGHVTLELFPVVLRRPLKRVLFRPSWYLLTMQMICQVSGGRRLWGWRTSCQQLVGRVCKHWDRIKHRNPSHHKIQRLWKHFRWHRLRVLASPCDVRLPLQNFSRTGFSIGFCHLCFASKFFGFSEATGRPKDSGPLSPRPALPGDTVASTAAQPRFRKRRPTQRIAWFQCWSPQP